MKRIIRLLFVGLATIALTACGGSGSANNTESIKKEAITKIMNYAGTDGTSAAPTVQDYSNAGVTGVTDGITVSGLAKQQKTVENEQAEAAEGNLDEVNAAVAASEPEDVDTTEEIQAIVDGINNGETPPTNKAPTITTGDQSVAENTTAVVTLAGTDPENDPLTWSITGGADQGAFNLVGAVLSFTTAPDFENPTDTGSDNNYEVEISVNDGNGGVVAKTITVTVTDVNEAPTITTGDQSVAENTTAVVTLAGTDPENDTLTWSITGGVDQGAFNLAGAVLSFTTAPDFENPTDNGTDNSYVVEITVDDGKGHAVTKTITVAVTNANELPTITTGDQSVAENTTAVVTLAGTDPENDTLTWSITGGADQGAFNVAGAVLSFTTAPDFENPTDTGNDNKYEVEISANDGNGGVVAKTITVTVTDVNEAPTITTGDQSVAENTTAVVTLAGTDPENDTLTWTITGGADEAAFNLAGDALSFATAPDFENPTDNGTDNSYVVEVTVDDGNGHTVPKTITVTVTNVNEAPTITTGDQSVAENTTAVVTLAGTDPENDTLTWSITGGADQGVFNLVGDALSFATAPNYEDPQDNGGNNVYEVEVTVDDGNGGTAAKTITVEVTDVTEVANFTIDAIADAGVVAGNTYNGPTPNLSGDDPIGDVTYTLSGADAGVFTINADTGEVSFNAPAFDDTDDANGDYIYEITITATDEDDNNDSESWTVEVRHADGYHVITYDDGNGNIQRWLDRNLGATEKCTRIDPSLSDDCMGDYYQWGRKKDGHENNDSGNLQLTTTLSADENPGHGDFIITEDDTANNPSLNWIDHSIEDLWQRAGSAQNGVCPAGWKVPSQTDFEVITDQNDTATYAYEQLNLHTSSYRDDEDGDIDHSRTFGFYWTSTVKSDDNTTQSFRMMKDDSNDIVTYKDYGRANGFQVRCIKD